MAKLSERVKLNQPEEFYGVKPTLDVEAAKTNFMLYSQVEEKNCTTNYIKTEGEYNMNTLRTLNLTLVDNNENLKGAQKIVFQSLGFITEHSDEQTIQQILMTGEVKKALDKHNLERIKVVDKNIQRNTGRAVKLEEVEIFDLNWQVVRVA